VHRHTRSRLRSGPRANTSLLRPAQLGPRRSRSCRVGDNCRGHRHGTTNAFLPLLDAQGGVRESARPRHVARVRPDRVRSLPRIRAPSRPIRRMAFRAMVTDTDAHPRDSRSCSGPGSPGPSLRHTTQHPHRNPSIDPDNMSENQPNRYYHWGPYLHKAKLPQALCRDILSRGRQTHTDHSPEPGRSHRKTIPPRRRRSEAH